MSVELDAHARQDLARPIGRGFWSLVRHSPVVYGLLFVFVIGKASFLTRRFSRVRSVYARERRATDIIAI